jgi:Golgi apyrase
MGEAGRARYVSRIYHAYTPGISTVPPEDIQAYLAPLLSHALQQIPPSQHASTPVYVLATAGMRLLAPSARDAILESTCSTLRNNYPFSLDAASSAGPCGDSVRVISGEEEGMWGWVAVNYLMDGFGHAPSPLQTISADGAAVSGLLPLAPLAEPPPDSGVDSVTPVDVHHHSPTFGFLDMGGASTQLAFSPSQEELEKSGYPEGDLRNVSLRLLSGEEVEWPVFVASWLGFGTNRVRERYVDVLLDRWRSSGSSSDLITPLSDPCLPQGLNIPSTSTTTPPFVGTGSFPQCLQDLRPLLQHADPCPTSHCLFGGMSTPHIDFERADQRGFIGISEYWYTAQQVLGLGGVWDWGEWEKGMGEFCERDWKGIEKQVEADKGWRGAEVSPPSITCIVLIDQVELSRMQLQCFKGAWISNVLHEGIGIPRLVDSGGNDTLTGGDLGNTAVEAERRAKQKGLSAKPHFQSMDEVGETAISWTLGKMVIEASRAVPHRSLDPPNVSFARLEQLGIQTVWAYSLLTFFVVGCILVALRRRYRWFGSLYSPRRGRKPSVSGDVPLSPTRAWTWPWSGRDSIDGYNSDEGTFDLTPVKSRATIGRIRIWSLRLSKNLRRVFSSRPRHTTLPLSQPISISQPPSPRPGSSFFYTTPALTLPSQPIITTSIATSAASSPPRLKGTGRPVRSRQNSHNAAHPILHINSTPDSKSSSSSSGGWNDPPPGILGFDANGDSVPNGSLTPTSMGPSSRHTTLSRQSSRVNLSELGGLAQRNSSRSTTPLGSFTTG